MRSYTTNQIITIHIFFNISRCKGNQTMECGQYIQYDMYNITICFMKNHTQNLLEKPILDPFLKI